MFPTNTIINKCVAEAKLSTYYQRMGCVLFNKKRIISKGRNYPLRGAKSLHPTFQKFPYSIHAEADAILRAKKDLKGVSLLVVRINKRNQFLLAKPCVKCMAYIKHTGIKRVFYSVPHYPYIESLSI